MEKILVTGATGFIGNYVVRELLKRNYQVIATSSNIIKAEKANWFPSVEYVNADISTLVAGHDNVNAFFKQPNRVIHLAWPGLPNYRELFHFEKNLPLQYAFIKNLVNSGINNITITGTCFEYGMKEGCLQEDIVTDPQNSYGLAKDSLRKF